MGRKSKDFYSSEEREYKDTIKELKNKVRRLQSDKRQLISELQSYKEGFKQSIMELDKKLAGKPVEEVIQTFKKKLEAKKSNKPIKESKKRLCDLCGDGNLIITKYPKADGELWYHRSCNNDKCKNRTKSKKWDESVED